MDSFCFWTNNEIIVDEMGKSGYIIHSNVLILMGIILIHNIFRDRVFENPHSYAASAVLNFVWRFFYSSRRLVSTEMEPVQFR
jgi:hypothetical protein